MLKRKPSSLSLGMKCGDCQFFRKVKGAFNGNKTCSAVGIKSFAQACRLFTPDLSQLTTLPAESIYQIAYLTKDLPIRALRLLSYTFKNAEQIRRHGINFGQPLYFNLSSPQIDYLDCYFKGYVLGISSDGDFVYLTSSLNGTRAISITLPLVRVLTKSDFGRKKLALEKIGHTHVPQNKYDSTFKMNRPLARANKAAAVEGDVPTLDTVPADWLYKYEDLKLVDPLVDSPQRVVKKKPSIEGLSVTTKGNKRIVEIKV